MEIVQIIGIGITGVFLSIILKQYKPEYSTYISVLVGVIIFSFIIDKLTNIISLLVSIGKSSGIDMEFVKIILKITGIAYLTEFAINICNDSGESAIGSKIELSGKIIMVYLSLPIIITLLETVKNILS